MSSRPQFSPYKVIPNPLASPANTGSMAANITSVPSIIQKLSLCSYSVSWSGSTPVGAVSIQCSNDYALGVDGTVSNAGTWNTMAFTLAGATVTSAPVTGNTGNGMIDIGETGVYAIRLVYTATSGSGTITVIFNAKVA